MHMDRLAIDNCTTGGPSAVYRPSLPDDGNRAMLFLENEVVAIFQRYQGIVGLAKPAGTLDDGLENRPDIRRRGGDHAENVAAAGLVSQRLGKIARLRLHLVEQTDVLDGDHRLVGEGRGQFDLLGGERTRFRARQDDDADRDPFA